MTSFLSTPLNQSTVHVKQTHKLAHQLPCKACEGKSKTLRIYFLHDDHSDNVFSVYLRTISAPLAHSRLAATYRTCLWSIRACTVMSLYTSHIQATAARPHGCNNRAKFVSQRVPTLFSGEFCKLYNEKLTLGMICCSDCS